MYNIIKPEKWTPTDHIILENNADIAVRANKNILVVAGPGAGKTELLAQKACFLLQTNVCTNPRKILAISLKKDAAENLKQRVNKRCGEVANNRFVSMTYDAFAKNLLDHFIYALPDELRPTSNYLIEDKAIIEKAFEKAGYDIRLTSSKSRRYKYYDSEISSITLPFNKKSLSLQVWTLLIKGFDDLPSCLTFKMISTLAEYIIKTNPKIRKALLYTYSHVFLDEFQDTTSIQYNLVKTCFGHTDTLITSVGDNKQRIMLWAGARKSIFDDFQREFYAKKISLIMNHRSAPRLVKLQKQMYKSLQEEQVEIKTSDKWNEHDGEIKLYITKDEMSESDFIAKDIQTRIEKGVKVNDICILCKQTPLKYVKKIIDKLNVVGIKARIETEYQDLIKEPLTILIINFLRLAFSRKSPSEWEYITEILSYMHSLNSSHETETYLAMQEKLLIVLDECKEFMLKCNKEIDLENIVEYVVDFWNISSLKTIYPAYAQGNYFDNVKSNFIRLFWEEHVQSKYAWLSTIENFLGLHSIPIMTIHKSKGLEYNSVYFIGLEDGAFWNFKNQPMEDKCAFFVCLSRAKQYVTFTYCNFRNSLQYPQQKHETINEFFELLQTPEIAQVYDFTEP